LIKNLKRIKKQLEKEDRCFTHQPLIAQPRRSHPIIQAC
jgi:hypothetical protein